MPHNHPPRCCCTDNQGSPIRPLEADVCPSCPDHGELAPKPCGECHTLPTRPHTDYCSRYGRVN